MTPAPFRWALRGALSQVRHLTPVQPRAATGAVARVYAAADAEFGLLAPPIAMHSPDPVLIAGSWSLLREALLVTGVTSRAEREVVAAGVSLANECPYCVQVHGAILGGVHGRADAGALAGDRLAAVTDPGLRELAQWARSGGRTAPPHGAERLAEALGVLFAFHYVNRMVSVFLGPSPLPPALPAGAAGTASAMLGRIIAPTALRPLAPGVGLDLLPAAEPGTEPGWATPRPVLATALARVSDAVERAGERVLGQPTRAAVRAAVEVHGGLPPALGTDWVGPVLAGVPAAERAATRMALLTALTPHRVDDLVVASFREHHPADADLLAATAWAALSAARYAAELAAVRVTGVEARSRRIA